MPNISKNNNQENAVRNSRKILVVSNGGRFSENVVNHSINLAGRLGYDLVALNVNSRSGGGALEHGSAESAGRLCEKAFSLGIHCTRMNKGGAMEFAVEDAIHEIKRVEVVVVECEADGKGIDRISVPVVRVCPGSNNKRGGSSMAVNAKSSKGAVIGKTVSYGLLSLAFCVAAFTHADAMAGTFARGGWYAALPIVTVLLFSFIHGAFAQYFWSALGIEAMKKRPVAQTERRIVAKKKPQPERPRAYAYVNPSIG